MLGNKEIMAKNIKRQMDKIDKTRNEVCADLGVSYSTFSDWLNAKKYPRIDKIELMANYFGVSKADLVESPKADEYYVDPRTAEIAQEIKDSRELSALFDAGRDLPPEDLQAVYQMVLALKRKEQGE